MELRVSDGTVLATFSVGGPGSMTFDGTNIWVAGSGTLYKLRTSDGTILGTAPLAVQGLTFDGANIWTASGSANSVAKVRASDWRSAGDFSCRERSIRRGLRWTEHLGDRHWR